MISASGREMAARLMQIVDRRRQRQRRAAGPAASAGGDAAQGGGREHGAPRTPSITSSRRCSPPTSRWRRCKTIPQVAKDPHLWEREMLVKMPDAVAGEMYVPGATIKMSKTPGRVGPVPTPGQHTDEVLSRAARLRPADAARAARGQGDRLRRSACAAYLNVRRQSQPETGVACRFALSTVSCGGFR